MRLRPLRPLAPVVLIALLAACGGNAPATPSSSGAATPAAGGKPFAGHTLVVATWGGPWQEQTEKLAGSVLEKETGATIKWVVGNPEDHAAKIFAAAGGAPPIDVLAADGAPLQQLIQRGALGKLDPAAIPNLKDVLPQEKSDYTVTFIELENGFVYNTKKFQELGVPAPTRFSDAWNPKLAGHVGWPMLNTTMGLDGFLGLAMDNGGSLDNVQPAFDKLKTLHPFYWYSSSADLATKFTSGDVWLAYWIRSRARSLHDSGFPAEFSPVRFGSYGTEEAPSQYAIVKGTKEEKLAQMFVNEALAESPQVEFAKWGGGAPVTTVARAKFTADAALKAYIPTGTAFYLDYGKVTPLVSQWQDAWNRTLAH